MIDKTVIAFNCIPGSGATTAANSTGYPVIDALKYYKDRIHGVTFDVTSNDAYIPRDNVTISGVDQKDVSEKLDLIKEGMLTPRRALYIAENLMGPNLEYIVKEISKRPEPIVCITGIRGNTELDTLIENFSRVIVLQIIRPTRSNGPDYRHEISPKYVTKKIFNSDDTYMLDMKMKSFVYEFMNKRYS